MKNILLNRKLLLQFVALVFAITLLPSCATYHAKTAAVETNLFDGNFTQAIANIDNNKFLQKDRNKLLYLLEKGKIENLKGNYEKSNDLFEQAYILIDDKIKTKAGAAIASKLTNPMAEPYKGEDFEKVAIHYYKALNYMALHQPNEALVEAKRINIKLNEMNQKYTKNKNKYAKDAFSEILQGILYETTGDLNNAFIAYRNAADIYDANGGAYFSVPFPLQLKKDLLRTSKAIGFTDEYKAYQAKFNLPEASFAPSKGEAVIFWENGLGPVKNQIKITASGTNGAFVGSYDDDNSNIIIPIPAGVNMGINAIAIPKYVKRETYYRNASLMIDNIEEPFELSEDYYSIAKQCLRDRMLREAISIALRFASKKAVSKGLSKVAGHFFGGVAEQVTKYGADAAGAAVEKADTRNWQSLPATISYIRVSLHEGENNFIIKKYGKEGMSSDTIKLMYKNGLQVVNYFDLSRYMHVASNDDKWKKQWTNQLASSEDKSGKTAVGIFKKKKR